MSLTRPGDLQSPPSGKCAKVVTQDHAPIRLNRIMTNPLASMTDPRKRQCREGKSFTLFRILLYWQSAVVT
jgi:hypothetical protein